jgi:CcmD family protein
VLIALGFYVRWLNRRIQRLERRLAHLETWAEDAG